MTHKTKSLIFALSILCTFAFPCAGNAQQEARAEQTSAPLEISADEALEWHRNDNYFIAKGNAIAAQGTASIAANTLQANYDNAGQKSGLNITSLTAEKNVVLTSQDSRAFGDHAVYDITQNTAVLTGDALKLEMPGQTVTASDRFEYNTQTGEFSALGNAIVTRPQETLRAHKITAVMVNDTNGNRRLDKMFANGNVIITTQTERLTGAYAIYNARTETAEVTGGVTIIRGPNILRGERATIDLKTQISRIFAGQNEENRVRGTFYPGSQ
jgi:lipopolysaccharide export system protein LptA